jgi:hypothetical protein
MRAVIAIVLVALLIPIVTSVDAPAFVGDSCVTALMCYAAAQYALNECMDANLGIVTSCSNEITMVAQYMDLVNFYCGYQG